MKTIFRFERALALCVWAGWVAIATAQSVSYLTPGHYTARVGDTLPVRITQGAAARATPVAWPAADLKWFMIRGGDTQQNHHAVNPSPSDPQVVNVPLQHAGVTLIALDADRVETAVDSNALQQFIADHIAPAQIPAEFKHVTASDLPRIRRVVSSKTLVRVSSADGESGPPSEMAIAKTGQRAEIRLMIDPTYTKVGSDIPIKAYIDAGGAGKVQFQATHVPTGKTQTFIANQGGAGYFRMSDAGEWRVEFHDIRPARKDPDADWLLSSATLTFEAQEAKK